MTFNPGQPCRVFQSAIYQEKPHRSKWTIDNNKIKVDTVQGIVKSIKTLILAKSKLGGQFVFV